MPLSQDAGIPADCARLVQETVKQLDGVDIIVNNAGWTRFANFGDLNDLSHDEWNKVCMRIWPRYTVCLFRDLDSAGKPMSCRTCA